MNKRIRNKIIKRGISHPLFYKATGLRKGSLVEFLYAFNDSMKTQIKSLRNALLPVARAMKKIIEEYND